MKRIARFLALGLFGLLTSANAALAQNDRPAGRVSVSSGSLLIKGPEDADWSYLEQNGVVYDGDLLWSDEESVAEVEMERGAWLRLGPLTEVEIRRLPPNGQLVHRRGTLNVDLSESTERGVQVITNAGRIMVEEGSLARIDVERDNEVRVMVRRGTVIAEAEGRRAERARAGQMFYLEPAENRVHVVSLRSSEFDEFDEWCDDRVAYYLDNDLPRGVDHYLPGIYELEDYGEWIDYEGERCWRPRGVVDDWRPYSNGYWGYWREEPIWNPYEPWGYTTCHYGGWRYANRLGWLWYPRYSWRPHHVRWGYHGDYVAWAPLDPWGRVAYRHQPLTVGNLLIDSLVWSAMPRHNFWQRDRGLIVRLDRAPRVRFGDIRAVPDRDWFWRDAPRQARVRGRFQIEGRQANAPERRRFLESRPRRQDFRVRSVRRPEAFAAPGRPAERVAGAREETRRRVRGQVTVPANVIRRGADRDRERDTDRRPGGLLRPDRDPDRDRGGLLRPDRDRTPRAVPPPVPAPGGAARDRSRDHNRSDDRGGLIRPDRNRERDRQPGNVRPPVPAPREGGALVSPRRNRDLDDLPDRRPGRLGGESDRTERFRERAVPPPATAPALPRRGAGEGQVHPVRPRRDDGDERRGSVGRGLGTREEPGDRQRERPTPPPVVRPEPRRGGGGDTDRGRHGGTEDRVARPRPTQRTGGSPAGGQPSGGSALVGGNQPGPNRTADEDRSRGRRGRDRGE